MTQRLLVSIFAGVLAFAGMGLAYSLGKQDVEKLREDYAVTNFYQGDLTGDGRNDVVVRQRAGDYVEDIELGGKE